MILRIFLAFVLLLVSTVMSLNNVKAANVQSPIVLELFTSQSCSSCPAADALVKTMSEQDPTLLALSYHVDYWDHLNWKDTYSSADNTTHQRSYNQTLNAGVFTPQLIVGGIDSMVGSNKGSLRQSIDEAKKKAPSFAVSIEPQNDKLSVNISSLISAPESAEVWEVRFDRYTKTQIKSGENGGRTLESINNVTSFKKIASTDNLAAISIHEPAPGSGVAILVQTPNYGPILGSASFLKN